MDSCGLEAVETCEIPVTRSFADFDAFWMTNVKSPMLGPTLDAMGSEDVETLKSRLRARLPADSRGQITYGARTCGERSPEVIGKDRP